MAQYRLYEAIQESLPHDADPIVEKSLRALESLPNLGNWKPIRTDWGYISRLVRWGFPFTFFVGNTSVDTLRKSIGKAISENGEPESTKFSEISAAALMVAHGANYVERVQETKLPTPDFKIGWNHELIELEVTRADQKQAHIERQCLADRIAKELHDRGHLWDIVIHFMEVLSQEEILELLHASDVTMPGNSVEVPGRWRLIAKYPDRPVGQLLVTGKWADVPSWWLTGLVESYSFKQYADTPDATRPNSQIRVYFGTTVAGYINPVQKKANRSQGSKTLPFVIAVDVGQLPNGFPEFRRELPNSFPTWQQVSAVLIFTDWFSPDKIGWTSELIVNPHAEIPLPISVFGELRSSNSPIYSYLKLTGQE